jgi:hypothetical protein
MSGRVVGMGRYEDLTKKRGETGLSKDEADELGRLMAERRGEPYGNARRPPEDVEIERSGTVDTAEELEEEKRDQDRQKDVDDSVQDRERQAAVDRDEPPPA